jgi:sulfur transfer protein SufE
MMDSGKVKFQADSDAQITKGVMGLLVEGLDGLTPTEIMNLTPHFIQQTGLDVSLTYSRANGFENIFQTMNEKRYQESDRIRDELLAVGITPIDRPDGQTRWERSN